MRRFARILFRSLAVLLIFALVVSITGVLVLRSGWFREKVRERITAEVEKATGGKVEIGSFEYDWRKLTAEVQGFVLHGTEPAGEAPLFRAERIRVGIRIISALKKDVDI